MTCFKGFTGFSLSFSLWSWKKPWYMIVLEINYINIINNYTLGLKMFFFFSIYFFAFFVVAIGMVQDNRFIFSLVRTTKTVWSTHKKWTSRKCMSQSAKFKAEQSIHTVQLYKINRCHIHELWWISFLASTTKFIFQVIFSLYFMFAHSNTPSQ